MPSGGCPKTVQSSEDDCFRTSRRFSQTFTSPVLPLINHMQDIPYGSFKGRAPPETDPLIKSLFPAGNYCFRKDPQLCVLRAANVPPPSRTWTGEGDSQPKGV